MLSNNNFEYTLFNHLENQSKDCISDIKNNSQIIENYYGEKGDIKTIRSFISNFNLKVLSNSNEKNFELFESVLKHKLFDRVLYEFRNSDIMILACRDGKEEVLDWLMTMDINARVQDANGCTALMYACKNPKLIKVVNYLCEHDKESIQMIDSRGQNAAFYAVENLNALRVLVNNKIDMNRINYNCDSVLTFCCRNKIYNPIKVLRIVRGLDLNIFNDEEKTAAMYLIEDEQYLELKSIITKNMNLYYRNSRNETALKILFAKYAKYYDNYEWDKLRNILQIIKIIIDKNISINTDIDDEGNTPFMYFLMYKDWCSMIYYIIHCSHDINFSHRNSQGLSASLLTYEISSKLYKQLIDSDYEVQIEKLLTLFVRHPTFDNNFVDEKGNNVLMYAAFNKSLELVRALLKEDENLIYGVNMNNENVLIMCAKLGLFDIARSITLNCDKSILNHQDKYGNTPLHYAIQCSDYMMVNLFAYNKADLNIKNFEGVSPKDLAKNDHKMDKYTKKPVVPNKMESKLKKPTFKPVNQALRQKFIDDYASTMTLKKSHDIRKTIKYSHIYEKSIKIYFVITSADPLYDFSSQTVSNCGELISMNKRNVKFFVGETILDVLI